MRVKLFPINSDNYRVVVSKMMAFFVFVQEIAASPNTGE